MRWEDERYVRVYTRDTVDWLALSFDAQALFLLLLRKVDRAGLLDLGRAGKRGVAVAVGHPRDWARLEPALEELLADGCVRLTEDGGRLLVPNFLAAQEAKASDRARQQKSRETARDVAAMQNASSRDESSHGVTDGHEAGQSVTLGHAVSHDVTPSRAVLSHAVPNHSSPAPADAVSDGVDDLPDATDDAVPDERPVLTLAPAEPDKPEPKPRPEKPKAPAPEALQFAWNRVAVPLGYQRWESMSPARSKAARLALEACPDVGRWEAWLAVELSRPFNRGDNPSGWQAGVDWLLRAKTRDMVRDFNPTAALPFGKTASGGDVPRLGPKPVTVSRPPAGDVPRL